MDGAGARTRIDLKVIVMGHGGVGKTSLVCRYINDDFSDTVSTIGASFVLKRWRAYYLGIWDTAGQERFTRISSYYCRGAQAAILVFDLTDRESFLALDNYARLLVDASPQCFVVVVGTKADLLAPDSRPVSADEARAYAESKHAPYYETSAKDNVNVAEVFEHIATTCLAAKIASEAAGAPGAQGERAAAPAAAQPDGEKQLCRCRVM